MFFGTLLLFVHRKKFIGNGNGIFRFLYVGYGIAYGFGLEEGTGINMGGIGNAVCSLRECGVAATAYDKKSKTLADLALLC